MKLDKKLIADAKRLEGFRGENAAVLIRGYETACFLSTGPIKNRTAVWEEKAKEREKELLSIVYPKKVGT